MQKSGTANPVICFLGTEHQNWRMQASRETVSLSHKLSENLLHVAESLSSFSFWITSPNKHTWLLRSPDVIQFLPTSSWLPLENHTSQELRSNWLWLFSFSGNSLRNSVSRLLRFVSWKFCFESRHALFNLPVHCPKDTPVVSPWGILWNNSAVNSYACICLTVWWWD